MKYRYFYQTKENENKEGWISARNRAEAYAALRKRGIRPYRVVGNDPVEWQPWAVGALVAALVFALIWALVFRAPGPSPEPAAEESPAAPEAPFGFRRVQLCGDPARIAQGEAEGWTDVFPLALDRLLAAYAQPGRTDIAPPSVSDAEAEALAREAGTPPPGVQGGDPEEIRMIKTAVAGMRREMADYLSGDPAATVKGYLAFLEARRAEEIAFREEALSAWLRMPAGIKNDARININARLRDRGLREIKE
ncbi:MAG: hypothetical protein K6F50_05660 [Kiritimatiellae bacterium]|nr:hypothetical protein [Kiritimatiellia bacterium]